MKLSEVAIGRPVLASMASAALVLFGVIGYSRLSVREFPDVDPPVISVTTSLPGANAQVVETAVTDILEEELSTIQGLRTLTSVSREEFSLITLEFPLDREVDVAAQDVRAKVSRVRGRLPQDILEPVIAKQEADAQPFIYLALSGANYDLMQLSDVADRIVKTRLQSLPGVGSAQIFGERRYAMRVWVKPDQLSARALTVQDVENAIRTRNVEIPAGRIESARREFSVRSLGELKTPQEFSELVVGSQGGQLVKLKDIARVELGPEDDRSVFRYTGNPAVAIGVVRQSKANLLDVAARIRAALPAINQALPPGVKLDVGFDQSVFVTHSINDARRTLVIAAILVVLIIFVFLRNLRATIIPGLTIPTSIVSTFAIMYFLGLAARPSPRFFAHKARRGPGHSGPLSKRLGRGFHARTGLYRRWLEVAVHNRRVVVAGAAATVLLAVGLFRILKQEFVPQDDRGYFIIFAQGPEGATLPYMDGYQRQVEQIIARTKDVAGYFTIIGWQGRVSQGIMFVRLTDWSQRKRNVQQVVAEVQPQFFGIPGVLAFASVPPAFGGFGFPVQYVVQNPDFALVAKAMDTLTTRARAIKGLVNVNTDLRVNKPELTVTFDRDRAEDVGVPVGDVAAALQTFLGGRRVSTFTRNDKLYYVMVQLDSTERRTPSDLSGLYVRGRNGQLVQLDAVAHVHEGVGPRQLNHFNRVRDFTLTAGLAPGFALGEALDSLDRVTRGILPPGSTTALAGESRELRESGGALYFAFGVAPPGGFLLSAAL